MISPKTRSANSPEGEPRISESAPPVVSLRNGQEGPASRTDTAGSVTKDKKYVDPHVDISSTESQVRHGENPS